MKMRGKSFNIDFKISILALWIIIQPCFSFGCQDGDFWCQNSHCISKSKVCNGKIDCPYSDDDEHQSFCKLFHKGIHRNEDVDTALLKNAAKFMELLGSSVNASIKGDPCPMLYNKIGSRCVSFFTPSKLDWYEGKVFCSSISGSLFSFNDVTQLAEMQHFIVSNNITSSDFWIGGQRNAGDTTPVWVNGTTMPMGTPYWAIKWNEDCDLKYSSISSPKCDHYTQMPANMNASCAAVTKTYHYYISDHACAEKKSVMCLLNR